MFHFWIGIAPVAILLRGKCSQRYISYFQRFMFHHFLKTSWHQSLSVVEDTVSHTVDKGYINILL